MTTWFEFAGSDTTRLHAEIVADLLDQQDVEIGECILAIDRMIRGLEDSEYLMKKGRSTVGCDQSLKMPVAPIGVPHHFNLGDHLAKPALGQHGDGQPLNAFLGPNAIPINKTVFCILRIIQKNKSVRSHHFVEVS